MSSLSISHKNSNVPAQELDRLRDRLIPAITRIRELYLSCISPEMFLQLPFNYDQRSLIQELVVSVRVHNPCVLLLIGIGGSNLGTQAVVQALKGKFYNVLHPDIEFYCADTVDTDAVWDLIRILEEHFEQGHDIIINIVSKSGTTIETAAHVHLFLGLLKKYKGATYHNFVVVTTDRNSDLWKLAAENQFACLEIPGSVGGRFSVLSAVGLFPLAFLGIDIDELCRGAQSITQDLLNPDFEVNHAALSASILAYQYMQGRTIHNTFLFCLDLELFGAWYRQLIGESLGKKNNEGVRVGIMPVVSIGSTDLHSVGQLYLGGPSNIITTFVGVRHSVSQVVIEGVPEYRSYMLPVQGKSYAEIMQAILSGTKIAYTQAGLPYISIEVPEKNAYYMGQLLQLHMMQVVYLGYLFGVNPFDQPEVELYKTETRKMLLYE